MNHNINQNLQKVVNEVSKTVKRTKIAKSFGYTTTRQLDNTIAGNALLSTKAIIKAVETLKVNPTFLFTGIGEMFLDAIPKEPKQKPLRIEYSYVSSTL